MADRSADIRNIALAGHGGSGKTLLAERLLLAAGAIHQLGELGRGTTVCDHDPLERELQHSLDAKACRFEFQGCRTHLLDTPGYPDLFGRALAVLPAVESVAVVVNAQFGVEIGTRRAMEAAQARRLCPVLVVNRIDAGADFPALMNELRDAFGAQCLPINLPADGGRKVVDCFFTAQGDATDFSDVATAHRDIIEQVVEVDEALLTRYLEGDAEVGADQLHDAFERALREGHLIPVCFTSAQTGAGIPQLLDLIVRLLPNPAEGNPPPFVKGEGKEVQAVTIAPDASLHAVAHVFKITVDPYAGRIAMLRVHQGTLRTGMQLFMGDQRKPFKLTHLYAVQGKQLQEVPEAVPGDICAVTKVEELHYDAVLHDSHDEDHHHLREPAPPPPMLGQAIEPNRHGDEQKLADALARLTAEDPSLRVEFRPALNEKVLYGHGELHLRVVLERLKRVFNVEVNTRPPSVPFRETIVRAAEGHHRHKKQTGGAGQFGEVFLRVEPLPRGEGFQFVDQVKGGVIPAQFIPAVEKGVRQVLESGAVAGFPVQDVRVIVHDGKTHAVDGKEVAFTAAGRKAFLDAISKAGAIVLEPIVELTITAPASAVGAITGDLSGMRGRILAQRTLPNGTQVVIESQVPLSELGDYHHRLKAHTAGEGFYTMSFSTYEPAPPRLQQELMGQHTQRRQEEHA
jgi:elongation factor G